MTPATPIVFVLDDDVSVRESLQFLIQREGWHPETFASAQEFLDNPRVLVPNCLVLDVSLPGLASSGAIPFVGCCDAHLCINEGSTL